MGACELKRQAKLEQWKTQVIDCRSSGMSVRGWCAEHNISAKTYYRREKEILSSAATELVPAVSAPQPPAAFVELSPLPERQTAGPHQGPLFLLYKRLEQGAYQWPRTENEVRQLTPQQYRWLMEGLKVEQLKAHRPVDGLRII